MCYWSDIKIQTTVVWIWDKTGDLFEESIYVSRWGKLWFNCENVLLKAEPLVQHEQGRLNDMQI